MANAETRIRQVHSKLLLCAFVTACSFCSRLSGQQSTTAPSAQLVAKSAPSHADLPPSTIYTETLAPAEAVRADIANWSDTEVAAFHAAMVTAKTECQRLEQTPHEGEEALALARLCSLGQDWDGTYSAARWYTRVSAPPEQAQHLPLGFGLLLQADLSTPNIRRAVQDLTELNSRLPLSADTDSIYTYAIHALEITQPEAGLQAALLRQPALLAVVAGTPSAQPLLSPGVAEAEAWHTLALLRLSRDSSAEQQQRQMLEEAISKRTTTLSIPDTYVSSRARLQYEWLGRSLPELRVTRDTTDRQAAVRSGTKAKEATSLANDKAEAVVLIVERADATDVAALSAAVDALGSRLPRASQVRLVLAPGQTITPAKPTAPIHAVYTSSPLLEQLAANPGPLFILLDAHSTIAYLGTGAVAWLNPQVQVETLLDRATRSAKDSAATASPTP